MANIGDVLKQPEAGWKRIDDSDEKIKYIGNDWVLSGYSGNYNSTSHYVENSTGDNLIKFIFYGKKLRIITSLYYKNSDKIKMLIDKDEYTVNMNNPNATSSTDPNYRQNLCFSNETLIKKAHEVVITSKKGEKVYFDAIDIDNDGFLLTEEEYNKLLVYKGNKYYNISTGVLSEITDDVNVSYIAQNGITLSDLNDNLNLLDDTCQIVGLHDKFQIKGIKTNSELIVDKVLKSKTIAKHIEYIKATYAKGTNDNIKMAIGLTPDDGEEAWFAPSSGTLNALPNVSFPDKDYSDFTEAEIQKWNDNMATILSSGLDISELENINFDIENVKAVRFAYVLNPYSGQSVCNITNINWQYDEKDSYEKMTDSEVKVKQFANMVKITPLANKDEIKVNILA